MITNLSKRLVYACLLSTQLLTYSTAYAKSGGAIAGGGGDASEERVDEIRADILKWIIKGGAKGLVLPSSVSYGEYESKMKEILQPQKVVVGFVEKDHPTNEELQVNVNGVPKTCRGFISKVDSKFHILCNITRFENTAEAGQYKLIHHEFAGLVNVENNDEAASDYTLSSQLTGFLAKQTVLRLAVKSTKSIEERKQPVFELTKRKDLGNEGVLFEMTLRNSEDVSLVQLKSTYSVCGQFEEKILKDDNFTFSVICPIKYNGFRIEDLTVQFIDGSMKKMDDISVHLSAALEDQKDIVKMNYRLADERAATETSDNGTKLLRKDRAYEVSHNVLAKDLTEYRGVVFSDGTKYVNENAEELAEFINSKKEGLIFSFKESTKTKKSLCTVIGCVINYEIKIAGEVDINVFRSAEVRLMKKGDITNYTTNKTDFQN